MIRKHLFLPALLLLLTPFSLPVRFAEAQADRILARVNETVLTSQDLEKERIVFNADMRIRNRLITREQIDDLRPQLMETLIERELLRQRAEESRINVPAQAVTTALAELRTRVGGSAALQAYLESTGQTQNQLRERLKTGIAVQRLLEREAIRNIRISEAEMEAFYRRNPVFFESGERIRVRHIMAAVGNWNDESQRAAARNKLHALKGGITNAADFAVMAMEHSDCPSRSRGGDLGYLAREQLSKPFADAAFALEPGSISDIVSTRHGYHLILMLERTPAGNVSFNDARTKIERTLRRNKENEAIENFVAALKSRAGIQRFRSAQ
jgi:peptidyl-prolyl cis-trans isomerase C